MRPWIRVAIAGSLGGVAMFFWASIAHLVTPLATIGIRQIDNEQRLLSPMQKTLGVQSGFYVFPRLEGRGEAAMKAYAKKLKTSPSGLLVYHPPGASLMETSQLLIEFASGIVQSLLAAILLAWAAVNGYWLRVGFIALIGAAAAVVTNISYWNWYGFPWDYTLAYGAIEWIGYVVAGLVIAAVLPRNIPGGLWRVSETEIAIAVNRAD